jgi:hypothetical protein
VRALAEREVVVRVALDVEAVRVGELALVVVGRYVVNDLRTVSFPATTRRKKNIFSSASVCRSPSTSASTSAVITSSAGSRRLWSAMASA